MKYYLYNPLANNGIKPEIAKKVDLINVVGLDLKKFFDKLEKDDEVVFIGGDGTLNHLVNECDGYKFKNNIYLLPGGTGNDFVNDIQEDVHKEILINKYLEKLPYVTVNGIHKKFINGIGFGIDGYCCEEADKIKAVKPKKKINYTNIALKGLLFKFHPKHVFIEIDGQNYEFDNVWLTPTMIGRFYGGGMMIAPGQDRFKDKLTTVVYSCKSKFKSLLKFPTVFTGKHVNLHDLVHIFTGNKIKVKFDEPCALQIDGDTVLNVTEYECEF